MNSWAGKLALVTGASSGIGATICRELVKQKMIVIGCARNLGKMDEMAKELCKPENKPGEFIPYRCDVAKEEDIINMHNHIRSHFNSLNVCINNAMDCINQSLVDGKTADWRRMIEVGILGLCINTREAVKLMKDGKQLDRYIIHMGNIANAFPAVGNIPDVPMPSFEMYDSIKSMTYSLAECLREETRARGLGIKVTTLRPGPVKTELLAKSTSEKYASAFFQSFQCLEPGDVAAALKYILSTPPHVCVRDLVLHPMKPYDTSKEYALGQD